MPQNGDAVVLTQEFYVYDGLDYLVTDVVLSGMSWLRSGYLAPVAVVRGYELLDPAQTNRMLKVPFDNDGFVRYRQCALRDSITSYEAVALYAGESRQGIVLGSVDHNRWKNAVEVKTANDSRPSWTVLSVWIPRIPARRP